MHSDTPDFELDFGDPAFAMAVLDAAPVIVLVLDAHGRIVHYNQFMARLCGRSLAEVRGRDWFTEFVPSDEREPTRAVFAHAIAEGQTEANLTPIRTADGRTRLIEWYDRKLQHAGQTTALVAIGVDVTDRVRAAADQAELAQRFALFASRVDEAFFMTNATRDRILYLSPAWERIVGLPREVAYADPTRIAELVHPDDLHQFHAAFGAPLSDGAQAEREYRMRRPDPERPGEHEYRWLWIRSSQVQLRDDQPPCVVGTLVDITERKQAQQRMEELGRVFALFDDAVDEVSFVFDHELGRVLFASKSIERVFGLSREAVYADASILYQAIHPDDRERVAAATRVPIPPEGSEEEYRLIRKDGRVRWVVSRLTPLGADSGLPGAIVSVTMDITERHEAEAELRQLTEQLESRVAERTRSLAAERERLRQILDGMAVHVVLLDASGRLQSFNAKAGASELAPALLGAPIEAMPGVYPTDEAAVALSAALAQVQRGGLARFDLEATTSIGCATVTDITLSPILSETGEVAEIVATGIDVTERRATERRLRETVVELERNEARLADAQRIAKVGDWDWDVPSGGLLWSDQSYRIFGAQPDEVEITYEWFLAHVHPEDRERVAAAVDASVHAGAPYEVEHRIVRTDGEIRTVIEKGEVTRDAGGAPIRMQGTVQDISDQKAVEAQLRASLHEKTALLHEIHHRVKNNLQVVASLLYLQGVNAEPSASEVLDECRARIRSMALIHEHLYLSGQLASIDMHEFLAKLGNELARVFAPDQYVAIRVSGGGLQLDIDRAVPLALAVAELLTNALKYAYPKTESTRSTPEIRVRVSDSMVEVADDGVGLPPDLDQSQAHSIGLRLVQTLTRQLDARLEFEHKTGTTIRLFLPTSSQS